MCTEEHTKKEKKTGTNEKNGSSLPNLPYLDAHAGGDRVPRPGHRAQDLPREGVDGNELSHAGVEQRDDDGGDGGVRDHLADAPLEAPVLLAAEARLAATEGAVLPAMALY